MDRKELERKVKDIVSKHTLYVVSLESNIYDDLGVDSIEEASIEEYVKDELGLDLHWLSWAKFWETKPTVAELCDFIEREL